MSSTNASHTSTSTGPSEARPSPYCTSLSRAPARVRGYLPIKDYRGIQGDIVFFVERGARRTIKQLLQKENLISQAKKLYIALPGHDDVMDAPRSAMTI